MLCTFITDPITGKVQCGECLCETTKNETFDEQVGMLHCFVVGQWQDIGLLVDRSYCGQGSVCPVSM
jgi:hypothetical protein